MRSAIVPRLKRDYIGRSLSATSPARRGAREHVRAWLDSQLGLSDPRRNLDSSLPATPRLPEFLVENRLAKQVRDNRVHLDLEPLFELR